MMKKGFLLLLLSAVLLSMASCRVAETIAGEGYSFSGSNETEISDPEETDLSDETDSSVSAGFERVSALEQPEFVEKLWLKEEEEVYYQRSAVIAKGRASDLAEYRVFGDHYDYYITAFDFTLDEIYYGEAVNVGDTVSVGSFNSSYECDSSLPIIRENNEYILFLHSTAENEQVAGLVDYNMPSPLFNCIPVVGDFCETKDLFSDYGESERKINFIKGKSLAYEALQNGEEAELKKKFADENYLVLANEEAKYIPNYGAFETKLGTTFVIRLTEFEETLCNKIKEWK